MCIRDSVRPVVVEPLLSEWAGVKSQIEAELAKATASTGATKTKAANEANRLRVAFMAVSYTHLDVYKRQAQRSPDDRGTGSGHYARSAAGFLAMTLELHEPAGATPLTPDELLGLKAKHIATRGELNELEGENIIEGLTWLDRRPKNFDLLTDAAVREIHKRLFGEVWDLSLIHI